jgi:ATP-dependent DNA ligase
MTKSVAQIRFIEPMYALGIRNLPEGPDWLYEIKLDGYRCLAGKDDRRCEPVCLNRPERLFVGQPL